MKVTINSKKGLKTSFSVLVDKKTINKKLDEKLLELQQKVHLKGFRPGKVPTSVIKNQFGKAIYGEILEGILKETSAKVIDEKKIKIAGQPKIELKTFGEGKDLDFTMEVESLPIVKLKPLDKIKATNYEIKIDNKLIETRLKQIAESQQSFLEKKDEEISINGDLVTFDYTAKVNGKAFEGNEGKNVQLVLGRDLFIKGFDKQLLGVKKKQKILVNALLPENYPKKELANKKADFECKIINIKKPVETKIDDAFAKKTGAKDINDLKNLINKQITSEYKNGLDTITKKNILDNLEEIHDVNLPSNLVEQENKIITRNLKKEEIEKFKDKNLKLARSRIKTGLILNAIGEKSDLKIKDEEIRSEIEKYARSMPGQEKMVADYYQKNPSALASLRGALYEDKIIELIKTKINLVNKSVSTKEAEDLIKKFTQPTKNLDSKSTKNTKKKQTIKNKTEKISKKPSKTV